MRRGYISDCVPLDEFDFLPHLKKPIARVREEIGLERELILAYYRIEKKRFPNSSASQRLLDT